MKYLNFADMGLYLLNKMRFILVVSVICLFVFPILGIIVEYDLNENISSKMQNKIESVKALYDEYTELSESRLLDMNTTQYFMGRVMIVEPGLKMDSEKSRNILSEIQKKGLFTKIIVASGLDYSYTEYDYLTSIWRENKNDACFYYLDFKTDNRKEAETFVDVATMYVSELGLTIFPETGFSQMYSEIYDLTDEKEYLRAALVSYKEYVDDSFNRYMDAKMGLTIRERNYYEFVYNGTIAKPTVKDFFCRAVIGVLFGTFLGVIGFTLLYFIDGKVKTIDDLRLGYHLEIFTNVDVTLKNEFFLMCDLSENDCKELLENSAIRISNSLQAIENDTQVILVIALHKSHFKTIENMISACERNDIQVVGAVVL